MDSPVNLGVDGLTGPDIANSRLWYLALGCLLFWQGWVTLTLFGHEDAWQALTDDRPIVSGRHPLHLYHGYLGARSLRERGTPSCYDPAFQAGYPKTPVFDPGSRPAELFLTLVGGRFKPEAYKIGFAACCAILPVFFWAAARGMGFERATSCVATALGIIVCWGDPCRELLEAGDLDLFLAGLADLATLGFLVKFHRDSGLKAWLGLVIAGSLGWYALPVVYFCLLPLSLVYYFTAGPKHGLFWHAALFGSFAAPVLINSFWLFDWLAYWWIRTPIQSDVPILSHRTFHTLWSASCWGSDRDRVLASILIVAAFIGVAGLSLARNRLLARLLAFGVGGSVALVLAGVASEFFGKMSSFRLLIPALWLACLPAAYTVVQSVRFLSQRLGGGFRCALVIAVVLIGLTLVAPQFVYALGSGCFGTAPLSVGLAAASQQTIRAVRQSTTTESRILIEESAAEQVESHWTPLLPLFTGRSFIGGLVPDAAIEHSYASLVGENLAGRPIASWSNAELALFCRRYNVGWVLCRSQQVRARFRSLPECQEAAQLPGDMEAYLLRLKPGSFVLRGQGRLLRADFRHIALADVVPEDGTIILSMHYQPGLQASPGRVQIEKESDPQDPVPFVRLRVPGPVARITLTWNEP
jgi:hypothetical protein